MEVPSLGLADVHNTPPPPDCPTPDRLPPLLTTVSIPPTQHTPRPFRSFLSTSNRTASRMLCVKRSVRASRSSPSRVNGACWLAACACWDTGELHCWRRKGRRLRRELTGGVTDGVLLTEEGRVLLVSVGVWDLRAVALLCLSVPGLCLPGPSYFPMPPPASPTCSARFSVGLQRKGHAAHHGAAACVQAGAGAGCGIQGIRGG